MVRVRAFTRRAEQRTVHSHLFAWRQWSRVAAKQSARSAAVSEREWARRRLRTLRGVFGGWRTIFERRQQREEELVGRATFVRDYTLMGNAWRRLARYAAEARRERELRQQAVDQQTTRRKEQIAGAFWRSQLLGRCAATLSLSLFLLSPPSLSCSLPPLLHRFLHFSHHVLHFLPLSLIAGASSRGSAGQSAVGSSGWRRQQHWRGGPRWRKRSSS
jgi:hypothetical protein